MDYEYGLKYRMLDTIRDDRMVPLYGDNLDVVGADENTTAQDYLDALAKGAELNSVWSHAGYWCHRIGPKERIDGALTKATAWRIRRTPGAVVTLIWGCHAGDFGGDRVGTKLSDNLIVNYAFGTRYGLSAAGATRSIGSTFKPTYWTLQDGSYLAMGFFRYIDGEYDSARRIQQNPDIGTDRWVGDYALYGDPFIRVDHTPTDLSIAIDDDQDFTDDANVTLTLAGEDAEEMSFRNEGGTWGPWEPFSPKKEWVLSSGLGAKKVLFRARNSCGKEAHHVFDVIIRIRTRPDSVNFEINDGDQYTNTTRVVLDIDAGDADPAGLDLSFSTDGSTWSSWEQFTISKKLSLSPEDGERRVYLKVRESLGLVVRTVEDTITLDMTPPMTSVVLEGDLSEESWYASDVKVGLETFDALTGVAIVKHRIDGGPWEEYSAPFVVRGSGHHSVEYLSGDIAGNIESTKEVNFKIDTDGPERLFVTINEGSQYTTDSSVLLELGAVDPASGVDAMSFSDDGVEWSPWEPFMPYRTYQLDDGEGEKTVHFRVRDVAGNVVATPASAGIIMDTIVPTIEAFIPEDGAEAVSVQPVLSMTFSEAIDEETLTNMMILLLDSRTNTIEGTIEYNPSELTASFKPVANLDHVETYTLSLSSLITDIAGNKLEGGDGFEWSFTTLGIGPSAPRGLTAEVVQGNVSLRWTPPAELGSGPLVGYDVYRDVVGDSHSGKSLIATISGVAYIDDDVVEGMSYYYFVYSRNQFGESDQSEGAYIVVPKVEPEPPAHNDIGGTDEPVDGGGSEKVSGGSPWPIALLVSVIIVVIVVTYFIHRSKSDRSP
jgi:hypothetical protein